MIEIVADVAADTEVKALIINRAVPGTTVAVGKLREIRDDIFVVYCIPAMYRDEGPADWAYSADLVLEWDELGMGPTMAQQAYKLGAKTFVHYSYPRHMSHPTWSARHELIKETCAELGIELVDATAPDPTSDVGVRGEQDFILEDVPKMIAKYGKDTAFFATNCTTQIPLIKAVSDEGGIYPQPCCPSSYHGYPRALGIDDLGIDGDMMPIDEIISATAAKLKEKGVLGRFSTCPWSAEMLFTMPGVEYAIKWLNGDVPKEGLDIAVLKQCLEDRAGVECFMHAYADEDGVEYPNYLLVREDYLTYGEEHIK